MNEIRDYLNHPLDEVIAFYFKDKALICDELMLDKPIFCLPQDETHIINEIKKYLTKKPHQ